MSTEYRVVKNADDLLVNMRRYCDEAMWPHASVQDRLDTLRLLVSSFVLLDGHLSSGGTPPEVWREGPDREPSPADEEGWDAREDFLRGGHD